MITTLFRQAGTGLRVLIFFTVLTGIVYPLVTLAVAQLPGLAGPANGSIVYSADGTPAGSSLIGIDPVAKDPAADPWFHTRPSASAKDILGPTDTTTSGGTNKGTFDAKLTDTVNQRKAAIATREGVSPSAVPADAVTASASGLDPDISPVYAALQTARVAKVTGLPATQVQQLVDSATTGRILGFLGEPTVNVTELNLSVAAAKH
ncbi:MAG: potassium-transporting ATPase subunit C [Pseudonocardiales bacterium]|nr:potassium-transporting ATPase subunit C [Pseudonocardiales bacterium]